MTGTSMAGMQGKTSLFDRYCAACHDKHKRAIYRKYRYRARSITSRHKEIPPAR